MGWFLALAFCPIWLLVPVRLILQDKAPRTREVLFAALNVIPPLLAVGYVLTTGLAGILLMIILGWLYIPIGVGITVLNMAFSGMLLLQGRKALSQAQ